MREKITSRPARRHRRVQTQFGMNIMTRRRILLFQYGSNMDPDRLNSAERLGDHAQVVGMAKLRGWGVRFDLYSNQNGCGVTDMIPCAREHVEGVLYSVPYRLVVAPIGQRS